VKNTLNDLVSTFKPYEVDFVIPNQNRDVKVYLDLYLMYESADPVWQEVQAFIFEYLNIALEKYRSKIITGEQLVELLYFPEVDLIGFGHCVNGIRGQGSHGERGELIKKAIFDNQEVSEFGIETLAKTSIQIPGIGPDLLSDLVGNFAIVKLINYTQEQVATYNLKTIDVPIQRSYDFLNKRWAPITKVALPYFEDKEGAEPRILVPRQISRKMPILSTDEFHKGFLKYVLQDEEISHRRILNTFGKEPKVKMKDVEARLEKEYGSVTLAARKVAAERPELVIAYAKDPHKYQSKRKPRKPKISWDSYIKELKSIPPTINPEKYSEYLRKVFSAMYGDNLLRGKIEKKSVDGVFRYDISFLNASTTALFKILNNQGVKSGLLIIEAKNYDKTVVANKEFNQSLAYTIKDVRELVFLIKRSDVTQDDILKSKRHFLSHKVVILPLADSDVETLLRNRANDLSEFDDFLNDRLQEIITV
jgi:hypothetical protein